MADITDVPLWMLTNSISSLCALLDSGRDVPSSEVRDKALDQRLIQWLSKQTINKVPVFRHLNTPEAIQSRASLLILFQDVATNEWGRSRGPRHKSGIAPAIALFTEAIQQRFPITSED